MGLCKCPKRLVTNQFCYEHRVNVCEHCMVQSHPKVCALLILHSFVSISFLLFSQTVCSAVIFAMATG